MKRGVLVAILVVIVFFLLLILTVGYIYLQFQQEPHIPQNSFLRIKLSGEIVDSDDSFIQRSLSVRDLFCHLQRAKQDNRIKGILLRISSLRTGLAKIEDIGKMVSDFKVSGKPVIAFLESAGLREYYLATFADKIYTFKGAYIFLDGLASEATFFKHTLSKLGVQAEMFHIGEYKTATNTFTEDRMTPAHRESFQALLDDIYISTLMGIARNRDMDLEQIKRVVDESPMVPSAYLQAKFIDKIAYEDEIFKEFDTRYNIVDFDIYRETTSPPPFQGKRKIAVIFASGEINSGESGDKSLFQGKILGSDTLVKQLESVRKNPKIAAVVLRIDSPGGSALASDVIRRKAELLAKEKPLVISMADLAASGGYWIAMASPKIMALPQTITGSIGVIAGKFVLKNLYDHIGINKEIVKTSTYADMFSDYRRFTPEERQKLQQMMEIVYHDFLELVADNRNLDISEVDSVARGRVWAGKTAQELKLVDKMGGLLDAIDEARTLAKIPANEKIDVTVYPRKKTFLDFVFNVIDTKIHAPLKIDIEAKLEQYQHFFPALIMPYQITFK